MLKALQWPAKAVQKTSLERFMLNRGRTLTVPSSLNFQLVFLNRTLESSNLKICCTKNRCILNVCSWIMKVQTAILVFPTRTWTVQSLHLCHHWRMPQMRQNFSLSSRTRDTSPTFAHETWAAVVFPSERARASKMTTPRARKPRPSCRSLPMKCELCAPNSGEIITEKELSQKVQFPKLLASAGRPQEVARRLDRSLECATTQTSRTATPTPDSQTSLMTSRKLRPRQNSRRTPPVTERTCAKFLRLSERSRRRRAMRASAAARPETGKWAASRLLINSDRVRLIAKRRPCCGRSTASTEGRPLHRIPLRLPRHFICVHPENRNAATIGNHLSIIWLVRLTTSTVFSFLFALLECVTWNFNTFRLNHGVVLFWEKRNKLFTYTVLYCIRVMAPTPAWARLINDASTKIQNKRPIFINKTKRITTSKSYLTQKIPLRRIVSQSGITTLILTTSSCIVHDYCTCWPRWCIRQHYFHPTRA